MNLVECTVAMGGKKIIHPINLALSYTQLQQLITQILGVFLGIHPQNNAGTLKYYSYFSRNGIFRWPVYIATQTQCFGLQFVTENKVLFKKNDKLFIFLLSGPELAYHIHSSQCLQHTCVNFTVYILDAIRLDSYTHYYNIHGEVPNSTAMNDYL